MALGISPEEIIKLSNNPLLRVNSSWKRIKIKEIANILSGYPFEAANFNSSEGKPLIRIRDVGKNRSDTYYNGDWSDQYLVNAGDLLVGMDGDFRAAVWTGEQGLLNQRVCRITVDTRKYNFDFFVFVLQPYLDEVHKHTSSVTVKHLSSKTISEIPVPFPSLAEQNAIAKKIKSTYSQINKGIDNLHLILRQIEVYRQAVLKYAFEGKLMSSLDVIESTHFSLPRLGLESSNHMVAEAQKSCIKNPTSKPNKAARTGIEPVFPPKTNVALTGMEPVSKTIGQSPIGTEIPRSQVVKLKEILASVRYGTSKKCSSTKQQCAVLRIPNIKDGNISTDDLKYANFTKDEKEIYSLKEGDILVIRSNGSLNIVGAAAKVSQDFVGYLFAGYLIRLRLKVNLADPDYINFLFQSSIIRNQIETLAKSTSGVNNVNAKELENLEIPLYPIHHQRLIVSEIKRRLSDAKSVSETVQLEIHNAECLKQSILQLAFKGELHSTKKPQLNTFSQIQLLAYLINRYSKKPKPVNQGEMGWAKHVYIADRLFGVNTGFQFQNWHYGPYDPSMKTLINTRKYFKKIGAAERQVVKVINTDTLLKYSNPEFEKLDKAVDELYEIFSKYSINERSEKAELLATVCKCIEDTGSTDLIVIRAAMKNWLIKVKGKNYTNKAEKFSESDTSKCISFIIKRNWHQKLHPAFA